MGGRQRQDQLLTWVFGAGRRAGPVGWRADRAALDRACRAGQRATPVGSWAHPVAVAILVGAMWKEAAVARLRYRPRPDRGRPGRWPTLLRCLRRSSAAVGARPTPSDQRTRRPNRLVETTPCRLPALPANRCPAPRLAAAAPTRSHRGDRPCTGGLRGRRRASPSGCSGRPAALDGAQLAASLRRARRSPRGGRRSPLLPPGPQPDWNRTDGHAGR